jgi:hypothetical protein
MMTTTYIESFHAKAAPVGWATPCPGNLGGVRRLGEVPALVGRHAS